MLGLINVLFENALVASCLQEENVEKWDCYVSYNYIHPAKCVTDKCSNFKEIFKFLYVYCLYILQMIE